MLKACFPSALKAVTYSQFRANARIGQVVFSNRALAKPVSASSSSIWGLQTIDVADRRLSTPKDSEGFVALS